MIHDPLYLVQARQIAETAHRGQLDKAGAPYVEHPARVAARAAPYDCVGQAVAWLHDVVEDTDFTLKMLQNLGLPAVVLSAVEAITHLPHEPNVHYWARIAENPLALRVKLWDMQDNTDPARLALLDPDTRERLLAKYEKAARFFSLVQEGAHEL